VIEFDADDDPPHAASVQLSTTHTANAAAQRTRRVVAPVLGWLASFAIVRGR